MAPLKPFHIKRLVACALSIAACRAEPPRAPFVAEPAPTTWERPAEPPRAADTVDEGEDGERRRLFGDGAWPCTRPGPSDCDAGSPGDGALGTNAGSIEFLDPALVSETEGMMVAMNLFEGLVGPARASGEPLEAGVAEAVTVSADGLTWTFRLRKDARWSNGRPVVAEDFVWAWTRKLDPKTAAQGVEPLYWIAGAEAFNKGESRDPAALGLAAPSPDTLVIRLRCPNPFLLEELAGGHWLPAPREAVEAHGAAWMKAEHIVTNGPYHLAEWKERERLELVRSETYWDRGEVRIPRVVVHHSEGEDRPRNLFRAGQIQWARGAVTPAEIGDYIAREAPEFLLEPRLCVYFYVFRVDRAPFDDARVRRAFVQAIDRERLVNHVSRGFQVPASGPVPPAFSETHGYRRLEAGGFDPDAARTLLAEAGYPRAQGLPPVRLSYNTMEAHKLIGEFVQRQLSENLGAAVELENLEWKSLLKKLNTGDYQMARYGWCASSAPPRFLELFTSDSPRNVTGWKSEAFDRHVDRSLCAPTAAEALEAAAAAEDILVAEAPIAPIYHYTLPYLKKPVLQGLEPHLDDLHPFKYMYWADRQVAPTAHPISPTVLAP